MNKWSNMNNLKKPIFAEKFHIPYFIITLKQASGIKQESMQFCKNKYFKLATLSPHQR